VSDVERLRAQRDAEYMVEAGGEKHALKLERLSLEGSGLTVETLRITGLRHEDGEILFDAVVSYPGSAQAAVNALIDCGYNLGDIGMDGEP